MSLGKYRTDEIDIVSGSIGFEKIHYAGVPSQRVEDLMDDLIVYIQSSKDESNHKKRDCAHSLRNYPSFR